MMVKMTDVNLSQSDAKVDEITVRSNYTDISSSNISSSSSSSSNSNDNNSPKCCSGSRNISSSIVINSSSTSRLAYSSKNDKDRNRAVTWGETSSIMLVPSRTDYKDSGLLTSLWWNGSDFQVIDMKIYSTTILVYVIMHNYIYIV